MDDVAGAMGRLGISPQPMPPVKQPMDQGMRPMVPNQGLQHQLPDQASERARRIRELLLGMRQGGQGGGMALGHQMANRQPVPLPPQPMSPMQKQWESPPQPSPYQFYGGSTPQAVPGWQGNMQDFINGERQFLGGPQYQNFVPDQGMNQMAPSPMNQFRSPYMPHRGFDPFSPF